MERRQVRISVILWAPKADAWCCIPRNSASIRCNIMHFLQKKCKCGYRVSFYRPIQSRLDRSAEQPNCIAKKCTCTQSIIVKYTVLLSINFATTNSRISFCLFNAQEPFQALISDESNGILRHHLNSVGCPPSVKSGPPF